MDSCPEDPPENNEHVGGSNALREREHRAVSQKYRFKHNPIQYKS